MNKKKVLLEFSNLQESIQNYYQGLRYKNDFTDETLAFKDGFHMKSKEYLGRFLNLCQEPESKGLAKNYKEALITENFLENSGFRVLENIEEDQDQHKTPEQVDFEDEKSLKYPLIKKEIDYNDETIQFKRFIINKVYNNKFDCKICGNDQKLVFLLKKHTKKHANQFQAFECEVCERVIRSSSILRIHRRKHNVQILGGKVIYKERIIKHDNKKGFENLDEQVQEFIIKGNGMWNCKICGKEKKGKSSISDHVELHHMKLLIPCQKCGKPFKCRDALRKHCTKFGTQCMVVRKLQTVL